MALAFKSCVIFTFFFSCFLSFKYQKLNNVNLQSMSLHGLFDKFTDALNKAFENDSEFSIENDSGASKKFNSNNFRRVKYSNLVNTEWNLTLSLAGMPLNDPSNDLFAPKSSLGKMDGVEVVLEVKLLEDGVVAVKDNDFTIPDSPGKWKIDDNGKVLAFSFACMGFERVIKTRGSILNIYGGEDSTRTSSTYFIPSGTCLIQCEASISETGRIFIRNGIVYGKDPNQQNRGKWSQAVEWRRTGALLSALSDNE